MVLYPQSSLQQPHPLTVYSPFGVTASIYLRSLLFNARSIVNKLSELHHLLYNAGYDLLLITETLEECLEPLSICRSTKTGPGWSTV